MSTYSEERNPYSAILDSVQKTENDGRRMTVLVPDIRCANCALSIENELTAIAGVETCRTSLSDHRVTIDYRGTSPSELLKAIDSLGYTPVLDRVDEMEAVYRQEKKQMLARIGIAGIGMMQVMMYATAMYLAGDQGIEQSFEVLIRWASMLIATPIALYSAYPFHLRAWKDLRSMTAGMDVPVSLAILAAWSLSVYETLAHGEHVYFDSVSMFTFFLLTGRYLELNSRHRYQQSQSLSENLLPETALVIDGKDKRHIGLDKVQPGDRVLVQKGEVISVDGRILEGVSSVDESAFTGESLPITRSEGQMVLAGALSIDGDLIVEATAIKENWIVSQISARFRESVLYRPPFSILADKVARYFVAGILILAAASGVYWYLMGAASWFVISLTVLVVSCPCALSLATPIAYTLAASALRNVGVVLSNGAFLERLAEVNAVVFDKTGTLTKGELKISKVTPCTGAASKDCKEIAAALEFTSLHPVAKAFVSTIKIDVEDRVFVPGQGVKGCIDGKEYRLGRSDFVTGRHLPTPDDSHYWVLLGAVSPICWFGLEDKLRPEAADVVQDLKNRSMGTFMYTGDSSDMVESLAKSLKIDHCARGMLPEEKMSSIVKLQEKGKRVLMIGDGINDTGAMRVADTSIAVSPVDAFVQSSSDVTILGNSIANIPPLVDFSLKVRRIIRQNIMWAVVYNLTLIPLAAAGFLLPWMAALGMSMSSLVVVLNANRVRQVSY